MKTKDIAQKYGIDQMDFEVYLQHQKIPVQYTIMGAMTLEGNIDDYVRRYNNFANHQKIKKEEAAREQLEFDKRMKDVQERVKQEALEAEKRKKQEESEKQRKLNSILTTFSTTGFDFEGYDNVILTGGGTGVFPINFAYETLTSNGKNVTVCEGFRNA